MRSGVLYIESGTNICSVAIADGTSLIGIKENDVSNSHAAQLTVFINDVLKSTGIQAKQLKAVTISKGPGSYTGLRIGVSAAKGICYAAGIPLIGIDSLDSMAAGVLIQKKEFIKQHSIEFLCPMIDARRMEVYFAIYDLELNKTEPTKALVVNEKSFEYLINSHRVLFFGGGAVKCKAVISHQNAFFIDDFSPSAQFMIPLAIKALEEKKFEDVAYFEPYYLKDFVAIKSKNKVIPG